MTRPVQRRAGDQSCAEEGRRSVICRGGLVTSSVQRRAGDQSSAKEGW